MNKEVKGVSQHMPTEYAEKIEAKHIYIKNLFDNDYLFRIPEFQRPFSWEEENIEKLFDDIKTSMETDLEKYGNLDDFEPYFLGSIIQLYPGKDYKNYSLIDGQQRMISLTILMAVIRDLIDDQEYQEDLQDSIYQKASKAKGHPESVRVTIRTREMDFFRKNVLEKGGTLESLAIDKTDFNNLSLPKQRIATAIKTFRGSFDNGNNEIDQEFLQNYTEYLLQKVMMVVITTRSLESAFRLFNVVNARGMPLTNADLLKSFNLGKINSNKLEEYTKIWEDIEEDIGIEKLEMLISFIRAIKLKKKANKTIYDEFEKNIFINDPDFIGEKFILYLKNVKEIYQKRILESSISDLDNESHYYNLMSIMRDFLPFNDWMTALIRFDEKFNDDYLFEFLKNLERKIFIDWIIGLSFTERLTQIFRIIKLIEDKDDPESIINDPLFHEEIKLNRDKFKNSLDLENFYSKGSYKIAKYVLLRINIEEYENLNIKKSYSGNITVEHILPRTPNEKWKTKFHEKARQEWTNKLGNLTLLNGAKNSSASNRPFKEKLDTYFKKKSDFEITNELEKVSDWNKIELKRRHNKLKSNAVSIWIKSA